MHFVERMLYNFHMLFDQNYSLESRKKIHKCNIEKYRINDAYLPIAGARQTTQMRSFRSRLRKLIFEKERFRCCCRTNDIGFMVVFIHNREKEIE